MFTRITKRQARKTFADGGTIVLCPRKLRPGFPFSPHTTANGAEQRGRHSWAGVNLWDRLHNEWTHYNASYEAGYYPAYYLAYYLES